MLVGICKASEASGVTEASSATSGWHPSAKEALRIANITLSFQVFRLCIDAYPLVLIGAGGFCQFFEFLKGEIVRLA